MEVIFAFKLPEALEFTALGLLDWAAFIHHDVTVAIYVCHAMPMTDKQLRQYRKLRRNS